MTCEDKDLSKLSREEIEGALRFHATMLSSAVSSYDELAHWTIKKQHLGREYLETGEKMRTVTYFPEIKKETERLTLLEDELARRGSE